MKNLLLCSVLLFSFGCATLIPVLKTETKRGEVVTMAPIQESSSRKDVPVGVAPRDVVAKVETKSGAKVYVVQEPFKDAVVYQNEQAVKEGITIAQPKNPWWLWPAIIGGCILLLVVVSLLGYLNKLIWWKK